ncbi:MAG TPA: Ig-like domain-containing protein [Verrucomicrobiae bacterium]|nr:Ig-like domain-containing protein [Verrucomicrobiae bacterium]
MKQIHSEVRCWRWARAFLMSALMLSSALPAAAASFKAELQAVDFGSTTWKGGPILGWHELDIIPCRVLFTGGPQSNYVLTITFDHTKGTSRGIEDLTGFTTTNVIINSGPTLTAPAGVDIWTYTLNVTVTSAAPAQIYYNATLSAGSHNFGGASLSMGGVAQLQIQKAAVVLGSPDMAITKIGATQAKTNQILTYVITYTNKLIAADTATGVQVIDTLPPQVTYVPGSGSKGVKVLGDTLTWNLGNLPRGKSGFLTYKVMVTNNIPVTTTFANYAQILGSQNDANPADNAASVTTTVVVIPTPLADDDFYAIGKNQTLTVAAPGVMLNDSNAVSASLLASPANGSLTFNTNGSFTYVPDTNFLGSDYFAYRSFNSSNMSGPAVVTIEVTNTCFVIGTVNTITNNDPGQCGALVNFALPITTGDCAEFTFSPTNGSFFPVGTNTVTFTNTDGVTNSFLVTVLDTEAPIITCPTNLVFNADAGQCNRSNVIFTLSALDNCAVTNLVSIPASGSTFPPGVTTVTNIATDSSGNQTVCTFTVTVLDSQGPTLTCPANIVVNAAAGQCTSNVTFSVTATDTCGSVTNIVSVPASGSAFPVGVTTVTNTATDNSGNTSTCTFTVTVRDNQGPAITCPPNIVVNAAAGQCTSNVTFSVTAIDGCGSVTNLVSVPASGSAFPVGVTTVTNTATDSSGNSSSCTFTVTVQDNQGPVVTCPANVVVNAAPGQCASNVTFSVTATDACGSVTNLVSIPATGSAFPVGITTVTNTATDNSGNTSTCTFTVTVLDNQGPALTCPPDIVVNAASGQCTSNVTFSVSATDACGTVTNLVSVPASGSAFPVGATTVTNIATDNSGNTSTCTFSVTVRDNQGPAVTCPPDIVVNATPGQCTSNVTFSITANDVCGSVTNVVSVPASGSAFPIGVTTVTNTATDNSGNTSTCTFTVTVRDNQGPTITCPANIIVNAASGQCTSNVTFSVVASDLCGIVTNLVSVPPSGSAFPVGMTTVTNTATDNSGDTSTCTFTVTVRDNQGPAITCPADIVVNAANGQCTSNVTFSVTANDACGSVTTLVSVPASGSAFPVGLTTVTNTATDNSGNTSTCTFTVTVRDNQGPAVTCPPNIVVNAAPGQCTSNVTFSVTAIDGCGSVTNLVSVPASGSPFPVGVTTVTNTATDSSGNPSTCTFTVTVRDVQPPTINCPANISVVTEPGQPSTNVTFSVTASDVCGSVTNLVSVPASGSAFPIGVTTVTNTATDNSGNTSTCTFTVTVTPGNNPPVANGQNLTTPEDTALPISLTGSDLDGNPLTYILVSGPANGLLSGFNTNTGTLTYTPGTNFNGGDSFTFRVNDGTTNSASATVSITITPVNDAPVAVSDFATTPKNIPLTLFVLLNDYDVDGDTLTITTATATNGNVSILGGTNLLFTPASNFVGIASVGYTITDGNGGFATAPGGVTITVGTNVPPIANNDTNSTPEDTALTFDPRVNDIDPDGDPLTITFASATNGTVSIFGGTNLFFTPATNFNGTATIGYSITDNNGGSNSAIAFIIVTPVNDIPVANGQNLTTPEDTNLPITLTGSDVEGSALSFILVGNPINGVITGFNTNTGALTYRPNTNYNGTDSFTFRVNDGTDASAVAIISITVTPVNDAPFANAQNLTTPEETTLPIALSGSDVEGSPLTFILVAGPTNGVITGFNTNIGVLSYTPNTNYNGADSFTFRVSDGTNLSSVAAVSITVTPVNDAPFANNQSLSTPEDTALPVTLTGSDVEGTALSFILVGSPANGLISGFNTNTGTLTYSPSTNYNGSDSFTFRTSDGTNTSAVATISITVTPVNDAPFANAQNLTTPEDTTLPITLTGSDVEGTALSFILVGGPANGVISGLNTNTGALTYLPNTNYNGNDSFTFRTSDGTNTSAIATISITVTPVNDAPFANGQNLTTPEDTVLPITLTGSDVEGTPLTYILVGAPGNGTITGFNTNTGTLSYRPDTNFNGSDSFTFRANDGTNLSSVATVNITVTPVNDAPFANSQNLVTPEDTALPITLTGSDVEGNSLTFSLVSGPANGTIISFNTNSGALTYLPNTNYNGADSFTFRTSDGTNTSAVATVSITVTPVNDAAFANSQNVITMEDTLTPITLTGSDAEGTPLTYVLVNSPVNGTLSAFNTNTGTLTYLPNTNYNGGDSFTFRVNDGTNLSTVATVTITIIPVADEPRAANQGLTTPEDTPLPITLIGTSPDGNPLTYQLINPPTHGAFVLFNTNSGVLTYQPHTNYNGGDSFTFRVHDGFTNSLVATVSITVTPVNDPPILVNDITNAFSGQLVAIAPLVNDFNPDGGPLLLSCVSTTNGTATISGTNILFTSASNFVGTVNLNYCATNLTGDSGSALITVAVTASPLPTFTLSQVTDPVNPQTGLIEQRVTITNSGTTTASAVRLLVGNINSPLGVPRTNVWLYNATGTNVDSRPYVLYNAPLDPGQFVTLTLEFVVPDRRPFTNSLEAVAVLPVANVASTGGGGVLIDRWFGDNRFSIPRYVIEWVSIPGRRYTVIYSDDNLATWKTATPSVTAVNTRTQWYDDGPPKTTGAPSSLGSRYYRVILAP